MEHVSKNLLLYLIIFALIAYGIYYFFFKNKAKDTSTGSATNTSTTSAISTADGSLCVTANGLQGTLSGGICLANPSPTLQIANQSGATVYTLSSTSGITPVSPAVTIPFGDLLYYTQITSMNNVSYYLTSKGWVADPDVKIVSVARVGQ